MCSCGRGKDSMQAVRESSREYCQTRLEARTAGDMFSLHSLTYLSLTWRHDVYFLTKSA